MMPQLSRALRSALVGVAASFPAIALAAAGPILMHRDPGCGCCMQWAAQIREAFGRDVRVIDDNNRTAFQRASGLPPTISGCHTAIIDGIAFEGHVPIADMKRVLAERPKGVRGLAVSGMPSGSRGMEVPGGTAEHFNVIAFGGGKSMVFARH